MENRKPNIALFDSILLTGLILAMCSQLDVRALGKDTLSQGYHTKQLFVALSDVALLAVFGWFALRTTVLGAWGRLWWPPLPCWALLAAMVLAAIHSPVVVNAVADALGEAHGPKAMLKALIGKEGKEAIAEILQFTAYFAVTPLLFVNLIHDRREGALIVRRRLALNTFAAAAALSTIFALLQFKLFENEAPKGLFGSGNAYGGFLAMALPLLAARLLHGWKKPASGAKSNQTPVLIGIGLALLIGLLTVVSLWAVLALFLGVVVAGWMLRVPNRLALVLSLMAVITYGAWTMTSKLKPLRSEFLHAQSAESSNIKKQYIEWYAALRWSAPRQRAFATGLGPGNYQFNIGSFYGRLPNEKKMPLDSNNLYLVQVVALGALGLGALLWVLGYFAHQARLAQFRYPVDWLGAGVLASLAGFVFVNVFHALIQRGTGIVLAFVLSLAIVAIGHEPPPDEAEVVT